jgi:hypothetical protein|tara:strand:- start:1102 stop:1602 length:501 start_codon:yes stop_codon:yes gene_type:complete
MDIDISKQTGIAKTILEDKQNTKKQELKALGEQPKADSWKSPEIDKLAEALAKAQSELEGAKKESTNPFFKSSYADLHAVIKSAFPHLSKYGLSVSQGNEIVPNAICVTTTLMHASGQWLRSKVKLPLSKVDAQGVGAAITYGRRYGLSAIVGIAQYDDDANSIRK